jgi:hypothetical protein
MLLPFVASRWIGRRVGVRSIYYDMACGGFAGVALGPLVLPLLPDLATDGVPDIGFSVAYLTSLHTTGPSFLFGGVVGGFVYWMVGIKQRAD